MTSLIAEASSFMTFTQPQILLCGASPDAARRTSPTPKGTLTLVNDKIRSRGGSPDFPSGSSRRSPRDALMDYSLRRLPPPLPAPALA